MLSKCILNQPLVSVALCDCLLMALCHIVATSTFHPVVIVMSRSISNSSSSSSSISTRNMGENTSGSGSGVSRVGVGRVVRDRLWNLGIPV